MAIKRIGFDKRRGLANYCLKEITNTLLSTYFRRYIGNISMYKRNKKPSLVH